MAATIIYPMRLTGSADRSIHAARSLKEQGKKVVLDLKHSKSHGNYAVLNTDGGSDE